MSQLNDRDRFQDQLEQLTRVRARFTPALQSCAGDLLTTGRVSLEPLEVIFQEYREGLRGCWIAEGGSDADRPERLSLDELLQRRKLREQAASAIKVLERVSQLRHVDDPDFTPLQQCAEQASGLMQRLRTEPGEGTDALRAELAAGTHPLAALLRLVERGDLLDDDDWRTCFESVAETFGRAMGTAVARNRIFRDSTPTTTLPLTAPIIVPDLAPDQSITPTPVACDDRAVNSEKSTDNGLQDPDDEELIFEVTPPPSRLKSELNELALNGTSPLRLAGSGGRGDLAAPRSVLDVTTGRGSAPRAPSIVDDALLKLMAAERYSLAAHLAQAHEDRTQRPAVVSGALLRALTLGRELCYPKGELASGLEQEFARLKTIRTPQFGEDYALAHSLWLRAACLRPALLGASPSATAILRTFTIQPGQSQLYNFCSRVAAFGDRLQGWATELFQPPTDQTRWQAEEDQLRDDVRLWLSEVVARATTYGRTSPLFLHAHWTVLAGPALSSPEAIDEWARWQEVLVQCHRLLRPIRDGIVAERNAIKQDLARLEGLLKADGDISIPLDARPAGIGLTAAMRGVLREALEFASRWLRLQASAPRKAPPLAPQAVDELRQDLLERAAGVIDELYHIGHAANSAIVGSATMCCRRAVEGVRDLCTGKQSLALYEAEPQVALNAILLKIPELELDAQMEPQASVEDFERLLLEQAWCDEPTWREAFEQRSRQRDHQATARIVDLDVWKSAEEHEELARLRESRLTECRRLFALEIEEFRAHAHQDFSDRGDLALGYEELMRRIDRLRGLAPKLTTFQQADMQLEGLKSAATRILGGDWPRSAMQTQGRVTLPGDSRLLRFAPDRPLTSEHSKLTQKPQWIFSEE